MGGKSAKIDASHLIKGEGLALDAFTSEDGESPVLLPLLHEVVLEIPKYFIYQVYPKSLKPNERRFKVFIPTTNTNKLSSRIKKTSIEVKSVDNDEIKLHENKDNVIQVPPKLNEFSKQDQNKLKDYFLNVEDNIKKELKEPEIRQQKQKDARLSIPQKKKQRQYKLNKNEMLAKRSIIV